MSRARHHGAKKGHTKRADGGQAKVGNPAVFAEVEKHTVGTIHGESGKGHLGRKSHRARGGADTHPYSSAHKHGGAAHHKESHHHGLHGAEKRHHGPHAGRHH